MPEETATVEAPVQTGPVNPALQNLFQQAWGAPETAETPAATSEAEPEIPTKEAPEPVIKHAELPPDELIGDVPKKTEPVLDEPPIPEEPPASVKTEKGKADWKAWRKNWADTQAELRQLREAAGKTNGTSPELETLKEQNAQLVARLEQLSPIVELSHLEKHPAFQQQFIEPRERLMEEGREALKTIEVDTSILERAMTLTGKARIDALDELFDSVTSPTIRSTLEKVVWGVESIDKQKAEQLKHVPETLKRLEMEQRLQWQKQQEAQQNQFLAVLDQTTNSLQENFMIMRELPDNPKWNETIQRENQLARDLLTKTTDPTQLAASARMAAAFPRTYQWALNERKVRMALEKEIADLKGSDPSLSRQMTGGREIGEAPSGAAAILANAWATKK